MSNIIEPKKCMICSESYKTMICMAQILNECDSLTLEQVLHNLNFHFISDDQLDSVFCYNCVTKVQSYYTLKRNFDHKGKDPEDNNMDFIPNREKIKEENFSGKIEFKEPDENLDEIPNGILPTNNMSTSIPFALDYSIVKSEIDIEDEIIKIKEETVQNDISTETQYSNNGNIYETGIIKEEPIDVKQEENIPENIEPSQNPIIYKTEIDIDEGIFTTIKDKLSNTSKIPKSINYNSVKQHECDYCDKLFPSLKQLKRHQLYHTKEKEHVCNICKRTFYYKSNLDTHQLIHKGVRKFSCDICNKLFSSSANVIRHKLMHTGIKPFVCDVCNKSFTQVCRLNKHKRLHGSRKPYVCDICSESFIYKYNLQMHQIIHNEAKPYACDVCKKSFNHSSNLSTHKLIHTGEKPFVCDVCNKRFNAASNFSRHKHSHPNVDQSRNTKKKSSGH